MSPNRQRWFVLLGNGVGNYLYVSYVYKVSYLRSLNSKAYAETTNYEL